MPGMPNNVRRFEFLSYLACGIFITTLPFVETSLTLIIFLGNLAWCLFVIFLIWSAARRHRNWARWTLIILYLLELIELPFWGKYYDWTPLLILLRFSINAIEAAAIYLIFTGDSRPWFRSAPHRSLGETGT